MRKHKTEDLSELSVIGVDIGKDGFTGPTAVRSKCVVHDHFHANNFWGHCIGHSLKSLQSVRLPKKQPKNRWHSSLPAQVQRPDV